MELFRIDTLFKGTILKRPSSQCRSPYVADILLDGTDTPVVAHAPALGCCGYADKDKEVYVTVHPHPKKCTHVIHLAHVQEKQFTYLIGMHPKSAEKIVQTCLTKGCIDSLEDITQLQREQTFLHSRFDFVCKDKQGNQTIIEVKNVPCGDYEDIPNKEKKTKNYSDRDVFSKIAYFPDGYRKQKKDTVSPRALKHVQELQQLKQSNPTIRCILIFVIQRPDCSTFQASNLDTQYKEALRNAYIHGVEVIPIQIHWNEDGVCFYDRILPFYASC